MAVYGRLKAIVRSALSAVVPGARRHISYAYRTTEAQARWSGTLTVGSGSPGRFRSSESVTSRFSTSAWSTIWRYSDTETAL
jgi:hypothetical protein